MEPGAASTVLDDPDVIHLLDLLRMLPGPTEDRDFWATVQNVWRGRDATSEITPDELGYIYGKMSHLSLFIRDPGSNHLQYLCQYLLTYFGTGDPKMVRVLSQITYRHLSIASDSGGTGRLWADDVTRTAWALLVKYPPPTDGEDWQGKWRFDKDAAVEWMPESRPRHRRG